MSDPRLVNAIEQHRLATIRAAETQRSANLIAYAGLLVSQRLPIPTEIAEQIIAGVGDSTHALTKVTKSSGRIRDF